MTLAYDWSAMGALAESITACRLTREIETAFPQLDAVAYPAKRDGALAELLACLNLGTTKYTWTGLAEHEDAISLGRLTAEIHTALPELDDLSYPIRRDAALTELLACVSGGCSPSETWADFGSREDSIVSGRMAADVTATLPGLAELSYPASRDAALAEMIAARLPCLGPHLVFSTQPVAGFWYFVFGTPLAGPPTIEVHDGAEQVITGFVGDVTVTVSIISTSPVGQEGLVVVSGTLVVPVVDGVAALADIRIDNTDTGPEFGRLPSGGTFQLSATAPGATGVVSDSFDLGVPT